MCYVYCNTNNNVCLDLHSCRYSIYVLCVMCAWCIMTPPLRIKLLDYYLVLKQIVCILCPILASRFRDFLTTRDIYIMLSKNREKETIVN